MGLLDNYKQKQAERQANYQVKKAEFKNKRQAIKEKRQADKAERVAEKTRFTAEEEAKRQRAIAIQEARHQKIIAGVLVPIKVSTNLQPGEIAYLELTARRMANVDTTVQETVGTVKKKHGIRRAMVGTVLTGSLGGGIVGSNTAGSKIKSTTTEKTVSSIELIDSGNIIFTNKRFIFIGNHNVISLPYADIIATSFGDDNLLAIKYVGMLNREYFRVFGTASEDMQLYYNSITKQLTTD